MEARGSVEAAALVAALLVLISLSCWEAVVCEVPQIHSVSTTNAVVQGSPAVQSGPVPSWFWIVEFVLAVASVLLVYDLLRPWGGPTIA